MPDFNRETRYIVVNLARLNHETRQAVIDFLQSWQIPPEECAVVEHDSLLDENLKLRTQVRSMTITEVMAYEFVKLMDDNADSPDTPDALFSLSVLADRLRHQLQHFEESPNDPTN